MSGKRDEEAVETSENQRERDHDFKPKYKNGGPMKDTRFKR